MFTGGPHVALLYRKMHVIDENEMKGREKGKEEERGKEMEMEKKE